MRFSPAIHTTTPGNANKNEDFRERFQRLTFENASLGNGSVIRRKREALKNDDVWT